jgi:NAD(P)-dependent dehydrogenase (short-subunit alcohol dehydrogenase family)
MVMRNKICLITGANAGLGRETALAMAKQQAHVVMLCRNLEKATAARQDIIQQSGNHHIDIIPCDLADLASVKQAAVEFRKKYTQLHVLVNNAGFMVLERQNSADGFEATLAVNYLAHVLLTELLLDILKASAPSRIIHVSSSVHKRAKLNLDDLMFQQTPYKGFTAYANSKLANILYAYQLARRLQGTGVTANALDPGMVDTEFGDKVGIPAWMRIFTSVLRPWVKMPAEGALTSIKLASDPALENVSGSYWKSCLLHQSSALSQDEKQQQLLWEHTQALLKPWLER